MTALSPPCPSVFEAQRGVEPWYSTTLPSLACTTNVYCPPHDVTDAFGPRASPGASTPPGGAEPAGEGLPTCAPAMHSECMNPNAVVLPPRCVSLISTATPSALTKRVPKPE